jgi:hypothetical protein
MEFVFHIILGSDVVSFFAAPADTETLEALDISLAG